MMTRIASVETHMISVPRPQPVWTAHEESKAWNVILTEVRTDDGLVGYGEIHGAPMPRICEWVGRFGEIIRGMDALAHIAVWEKQFALTSPRPGGIDGRDGLPPPVPRGERALAMAALAGIDIALWDVKGKAAGSPMRPAVTTGRRRPTRITARNSRGSSTSAIARSSLRPALGLSPKKPNGSVRSAERSAMGLY
jgi:L-alanine-DL-glutamate epimerase-like enolase superfamily enzyme